MKKILSLVLTLALALSCIRVMPIKVYAKEKSIAKKTSRPIDENGRFEVKIQVPGEDGYEYHDEVIVMVDGSYSTNMYWETTRNVIIEIGRTVLEGNGNTLLTLMTFGMADNIVLEHVASVSELDDALPSLPGGLLYGRSSTNCEAGFTGIEEYINNHDSSLNNAYVIYITDGAINTDETEYVFYDWRNNSWLKADEYSIALIAIEQEIKSYEAGNSKLSNAYITVFGDYVATMLSEEQHDTDNSQLTVSDNIIENLQSTVSDNSIDNSNLADSQLSVSDNSVDNVLIEENQTDVEQNTVPEENSQDNRIPEENTSLDTNNEEITSNEEIKSEIQTTLEETLQETNTNNESTISENSIESIKPSPYQISDEDNQITLSGNDISKEKDLIEGSNYADEDDVTNRTDINTDSIQSEDLQIVNQNQENVSEYSIESKVSITEEQLMQWAELVWKDVYEYSGMNPEKAYSVSDAERAFVKYDKENNTYIQDMWYYSLWGRSYPDRYTRTPKAGLKLAENEKVNHIYMVDSNTATDWIVNMADSADNISFYEAGAMSNLLTTITSILTNLAYTPYNDVIVTDYMSKWVNLDKLSIKIVDNYMNSTIWTSTDGWIVSENRPTSKEVPVVIEEVSSDMYSQGGPNVEGNTNGSIYKITWNVKDGAMLRNHNYSLIYEVDVDTEETGFNYNTTYPANGKTTIDYIEKKGNEFVERTEDIEVPNVIINRTETEEKPNEEQKPPQDDGNTNKPNGDNQQTKVDTKQDNNTNNYSKSNSVDDSTAKKLNTVKNPITGDDSNLGVILAVVIVSGGALIILQRRNKYK